MLLRERRALRRDRHGESARMAADHVDLPFAHDCLASRRLDDVRRGVGKREENVRFLKKNGLGRIDVLRRLFLVRENTPRERDRAVLTVRNREHKPPAEAIEPRTVLVPGRQQYAGGDKIFVGEVVLLRPRAHSLRGKRGVSDFELRNDCLR